MAWIEQFLEANYLYVESSVSRSLQLLSFLLFFVKFTVNYWPNGSNKPATLQLARKLWLHDPTQGHWCLPKEQVGRKQLGFKNGEIA